jgi:N-acyl-D-aspartate/D-glutamate deacylase
MEDLARLSGGAITWTALLGGYGGPGSHRPILQRTAQMQAAGLRIVPQVSCKPIIFEYDLEEPFPLEAVECMAKLGAGTREARKAAYGDAGFRRALTLALAQRRPTLWQNTQFTHAPGEEGLLGRPVSELAKERRITAEDLVLDVALRTDLAVRIASGLQNTDEYEVAELLRDPNVVLCLSDAGAHASQICDATYPTHLLGHWVREMGVLSLEEAIRILTSRPAQVMGIRDRGLLARGRPADVVIFDPARVGPRPTRREYDFPARAPRLVAEADGIGAVIVNGVPIRRDGRDVVDPNAHLPGRLLRHGMAQPRSESARHMGSAIQ